MLDLGLSLESIERDLFEDPTYKKLLEQVSPEERAQVEETMRKLVKDFYVGLIEPLENLPSR